MTLQPFDVVVVPFPYSDRLAEKRRPALVVSHAELSVRLRRVWVAMITSTPPGELGDVALDDFEAAGLPVASTIRESSSSGARSSSGSASRSFEI